MAVPNPPTVYGGAVVAAGAIAIAGEDTDPEAVLTWLRALASVVRDGRLLITPSGRKRIGPLPLLPEQLPTDQAAAREALRTVWTDATGFLSWREAARFVESPHLWGPVFWQALHDTSAFFLRRRRAAMLRVFEQLPAVLPCSTCRRHIAINLASMRDELRSARTRLQFVDTVLRLHNRVSSMLKGAGRALHYPLLSASDEVAAAGGELTTAAALRMLRTHGRSSVQRDGEPDREECGCSQRAVFAAGKLEQVVVA